MSVQESSPSSASPVPQPVAAPVRTSAVWPAWLALVLVVAALGWVWMLQQQLAQTQESFARRLSDAAAEVDQARTLATQADSVSKDLTARIGVAELRLSEVSLQRAQLEELMLSVSRSRDDSLVQDIESALRLAVQQSQLTGSIQPLISALQGADERIQRAAQPRLNPVQRAIARDIERLRMAELMDVPALVTRIDELLRAANEWPLRNAPRAPVVRAVSDAPTSVDASASAETPDPAQVVDTAASPEGLWAPLWARLTQWRQEVGARWWAQFRASAGDLVRVSRIDQPEAALLAPEQSYLLRENVKLQLLNVRLGLLGRQVDTARADVLVVRDLLERYFDDTHPSTRRALDALTLLHRDMRQAAVPRMDETFGALTVAASGR